MTWCWWKLPKKLKLDSVTRSITSTCWTLYRILCKLNSEVLWHARVCLLQLIRDEIQSGKSDKEIYKKLEDDYGETVLYAPKFDMQTAALWLSPVSKTTPCRWHYFDRFPFECTLFIYSILLVLYCSYLLLEELWEFGHTTNTDRRLMFTSWRSTLSEVFHWR